MHTHWFLVIMPYRLHFSDIYSHKFQYHSHSDKLLRLCLRTLYLLVANSDYGFSKKKKDRDMYRYLAIVKIETSVLTHVLHAIITQLSLLSFN